MAITQLPRESECRYPLLGPQEATSSPRGNANTTLCPIQPDTHPQSCHRAMNAVVKHTHTTTTTTYLMEGFVGPARSVLMARQLMGYSGNRTRVLTACPTHSLTRPSPGWWQWECAPC